MLIEYLLSKFKNGEERYRTEPHFHATVYALANGYDPIGLIDNLLQSNSDLTQKLQEHALSNLAPGFTQRPLNGFHLKVMENNFAVKEGEAILFLSSKDFKEYQDNYKVGVCPKCKIVPAKSGGCINHQDCPNKKSNK